MDGNSFFVDDVPVRVFSNDEKRIGVPYPQTRPMGIYSSIWNADDWATQGGRVKTDWSHAPFISTYRNFNIDACKYSSPQSLSSRCSLLWEQPVYASLNAKQSMQLKWVQEKYMIYDYCEDSARFPTPPAECAWNGLSQLELTPISHIFLELFNVYIRLLHSCTQLLFLWAFTVEIS